jgi:hypothetical protein
MSVLDMFSKKVPANAQKKAMPMAQKMMPLATNAKAVPKKAVAKGATRLKPTPITLGAHDVQSNKSAHAVQGSTSNPTKVQGNYSMNKLQPQSRAGARIQGRGSQGYKLQ